MRFGRSGLSLDGMSRRHSIRIALRAGLAVLAAGGCLTLFGAATRPASLPATGPACFIHRDITATMFWVGETAGPDNHNIANAASAWDDRWQAHYGGVDEPLHRKGWLPAKFVPGENPFYYALPYNDFADGKRRPDAARVVPWAATRPWHDKESMCKNRWVRITRKDRTCYAQWEDVGPFETDDSGYVFGDARPRNKDNRSAGIDLSPACCHFLGVDGMTPVDWQFVDDADVPDGPWKTTVTRSGIDWR